MLVPRDVHDLDLAVFQIYAHIICMPEASGAENRIMKKTTSTGPEITAANKEHDENRLHALHRQIADSMDHLINEECTYADVLSAPVRIQDSLRELRRLDEERYLEDLRWVRKYFPRLAAEVDKEVD